MRYLLLVFGLGLISPAWWAQEIVSIERTEPTIKVILRTPDNMHIVTKLSDLAATYFTLISQTNFVHHHSQ
jgi:hypothetical protein